MRKSVIIAGLALGFGMPFPASAEPSKPEPPPDAFLKLRDPFKPPASEAIRAVGSELEQCPVEQIKLVAVLTGPEHLRAVVLLPSGKSYIIGEKTKLGPKKGVLTKIGFESLSVHEKILNVLGQEEDVETQIPLETVSRLSEASTSSGQDGGAPGMPMMPSGPPRMPPPTSSGFTPNAAMSAPRDMPVAPLLSASQPKYTPPPPPPPPPSTANTPIDERTVVQRPLNPIVHSSGGH